MITVKSTINLANQSVPNVIPVVQGDTGRSILLSLADFTIPAGATARYFITKPSGLAVYNDATIDGNTVLVDLTAQSLAEYGDCPGQVRISVGDIVVTSFEFILHVEPFRGIDAVESTTETNIFDKAVEDAREAIAEAAEEAEEYISQALDTTLTIPDKAADAKATGDAISDSADAVIAQMRAEIADVYPTETAQGNPATFDDGADDIPVKDLKVSIVPNQDLHGYDKPWAGGAGKNKLEYPYVTASSTINGVTFTVNSDGTVKANGTATDNCNFVLANKQRLDKLASGTYIMNGGPAGGAPDGSTYFLGFYAPNKSAYDFGNGTNISLSGNEDASANIYIRIANGYTANNLVFKPMIRLATESDATFAPYSNICPITGMTEVDVERTGVNQWDEEWEVGNISAVDGSTVSGDNTIRTKNYIPVSPSTSYFIKSSNSGIYAVFMYAADKAYIGSEEYSNITNHVLTTPNNCCYLKFRNYAGYGVVYKNDISINLPSTDTDYHAYQGQTVTTDLGRTVYGGTLDVTTGVLTVDRALTTITSVQGKAGSTLNNEYYYTGVQNAIVPTEPVISDTLPYESSGNVIYNNNIKAVGCADNGIILLGLGLDGPSDMASANTYLSANPITVCYTLKTPQTYQLTPQEVLSVLGTNHISTNAESVDVVYRADIAMYIGKLIPSAQTLSLSRPTLMMQTPIADEPLEEEEPVEELEEEITPEEDEED